MIYDIAFFIFSLFYLPALVFKGKLHKDFIERFGIYDDAKRAELAASCDTIWIQAVSVGEVSLCRTLIPRLRETFPGSRIVLSTITKTGNDLAKRLFSRDAVIMYFPLDFSAVVKKVVLLVRPRIYIMIETEIWPNLLKEISARSVPSILINGRISDRSFGKYKLASPFLKNILEKTGSFCMRSGTDAERIIALGAPREKVTVTGNMKFDIGPSPDTGSAQEMRRLIGLENGEELFVAGSTHKGEEGVVITVFRELSKEFPNIRLAIAPRHIERAGVIEMAAKSLGFESVRLSAVNYRPSAKKRKPIFILDTIGRLNDAYSLATLVFVGGSLARHGGQNPIEPAVLAKPVVFGPHMFNFADIADMLVSCGGAMRVSGKNELLEISRLLLKHRQKRLSLGANARNAVRFNQGATERNIEMIKRLSQSKITA